jgi:hypothetical protein
MRLNQDFTMSAGDTCQVKVTVTKSNGAAFNLTGYSVTWVSRPEWNSDAPNLVTKQTGAGVTITDAANGRLTIDLGPADTADLAAGRYFHGAVVSGSGNVYSLLVGDLRLYPRIA